MSAGAAGRPRRPRLAADPARFTRRRILVLVGVHVLIAAHVVHWRLAGRTLAPLEFNEVMHALELGIVTAGFLLMAAAFAATCVFGRFFCGWGCHVIALQDLAAATMAKFGVRPRAVRSRALALVPVGAALYMFVWPTALRALEGRPAPSLRIAGESEGWASFVTSDFWRNLPGPGVALATFLVCAGVLVFFAGSRGFCRYACPYGVIFRIADRVAPGRIRRAGDCDACARCTAACSSNIDVHGELRTFGTVVDSQCLRDMDCVAACPSGAIRFGFGAPGFAAKATRPRARRNATLTRGEEALAAVVFVATLLSWRGLYGLFPLFQSLALALVAAIGATAVLRTARRPDADFGPVPLRRGGKLRSGGRALVAVAVLFGAATLHGGVVQAFRFVASSASVDAASSDADLERAVRAFGRAESLGAVAWPDLNAEAARVRALLAGRAWSRGDRQAAREHLKECVRLRPGSAALRAEHGATALECGEVGVAVAELALAVRLEPDHAAWRHNYAVALAAAGRRREAVAEAETAVRLAPEDGSSRALLERLRTSPR